MPPSVDANKRVLLVPGATWRGLDHQPVELAVHDARRDPGAGDRVREHRRVGAGPHHVDLRGEARRVHRGGRGPIGRREHGDRSRAGGGDEIAANPGTQAVGFIGSIATGLTVAARAAGKELLLEMGGNGPLVVMDDADLDAAVAATLAACFLNAGQSCTAGERILVHESVREEYLALADRGDRQADPHRRSVRRRHDARAREQRADRRQDGARTCATPSSAAPWCWRAGAARRATAATSSSRRPSSTASRRTWRSRARRRSARWRPSVDDPLDGRGDRRGQRLAVRAPVRDLHPRPRRRAAVRRGGAGRMGQRQRGHELLGVAPAVRRAGGLAERRRARGRAVLHGSADRAEDRRAQPGLSAI